MELEELNAIKKKLHNAIANGVGIDHKLDLMGEVDILIAEFKALKKEYKKLMDKNDRLEQQYMILKGSHDLFSKANSHNHFDE